MKGLLNVGPAPLHRLLYELSRETLCCGELRPDGHRGVCVPQQPTRARKWLLPGLVQLLFHPAHPSPTLYSVLHQSVGEQWSPAVCP